MLNLQKPLQFHMEALTKREGLPKLITTYELALRARKRGLKVLQPTMDRILSGELKTSKLSTAQNLATLFNVTVESFLAAGKSGYDYVNKEASASDDDIRILSAWNLMQGHTKARLWAIMYGEIQDRHPSMAPAFKRDMERQLRANKHLEKAQAALEDDKAHKRPRREKQAQMRGQDSP